MSLWTSGPAIGWRFGVKSEGGHGFHVSKTNITKILLNEMQQLN